MYKGRHRVRDWKRIAFWLRNQNDYQHASVIGSWVLHLQDDQVVELALETPHDVALAAFCIARRIETTPPKLNFTPAEMSGSLPPITPDPKPYVSAIDADTAAVAEAADRFIRQQQRNARS